MSQDMSKTTMRFKLNKQGLAQLADRGQTGDAMARVAEKVLPRVMSNGGRFTKGYRVTRVKVNGTAGARLGTNHPMAHWDEWGNIYRAPRAPLRRALSSAGLLAKTKQVGKP